MVIYQFKLLAQLIWCVGILFPIYLAAACKPKEGCPWGPNNQKGILPLHLLAWYVIHDDIMKMYLLKIDKDEAWGCEQSFWFTDERKEYLKCDVDVIWMKK